MSLTVAGLCSFLEEWIFTNLPANLSRELHYRGHLQKLQAVFQFAAKEVEGTCRTKQVEINRMPIWTSMDMNYLGDRWTDIDKFTWRKNATAVQKIAYANNRRPPLKSANTEQRVIANFPGSCNLSAEMSDFRTTTKANEVINHVLLLNSAETRVQYDFMYSFWRPSKRINQRLAITF